MDIADGVYAASIRDVGGPRGGVRTLVYRGHLCQYDGPEPFSLQGGLSLRPVLEWVSG